MTAARRLAILATWTSRLCQAPRPRPVRPPRTWPSGSACSRSTSCGARRTSGSRSRWSRSRPSSWDPADSCSPACSCSAGASPATAGQPSGSAGSSCAIRSWSGALLLGGGMGMVALGEQTVPAGITALLIALMPLWVAVLGRLVFGERTSRLVLAGIVIGLVGVVILVAPTGGGALAVSAGGLAAVLLSPVSWASGSLYSSHRARLPRLPLMATAAPDVLWRHRPRRPVARDRRGRPLLAGGGHRPLVARARLSRDDRERHRLHDVRVAAARRAAAQDRDVRLRQPGRGVRPERDRARRSASRRGRSSRPSSSSRRSPSSSPPGAAPPPRTTRSRPSRWANRPSICRSTDRPWRARSPDPPARRRRRRRRWRQRRPSRRRPSRRRPLRRPRRSWPPRPRPPPSGPPAGRGP